MKTQTRRNINKTKRKMHIRKTVSGSAEKPRLTVYRSAKHIYVQAIDDITRVTVASASDAEVKGKNGIERSELVGKAIGKKLTDLGIDKGVFDRSGYKYHGNVKALADGIRSAGINL
jgi:large subunit ribosomal protein L18